MTFIEYHVLCISIGLGRFIVTMSYAGLGSIPELELELIPIPIPGIGIEKELNKRNWNWNWN